MSWGPAKSPIFPSCMWASRCPIMTACSTTCRPAGADHRRGAVDGGAGAPGPSGVPSVGPVRHRPTGSGVRAYGGVRSRRPETSGGRHAVPVEGRGTRRGRSGGRLWRQRDQPGGRGGGDDAAARFEQLADSVDGEGWSPTADALRHAAKIVRLAGGATPVTLTIDGEARRFDAVAEQLDFPNIVCSWPDSAATGVPGDSVVGGPEPDPTPPAAAGNASRSAPGPCAR